MVGQGRAISMDRGRNYYAQSAAVHWAGYTHTHRRIDDDILEFSERASILHSSRMLFSNHSKSTKNHILQFSLNKEVQKPRSFLILVIFRRLFLESLPTLNSGLRFPSSWYLEKSPLTILIVIHFHVFCCGTRNETMFMCQVFRYRFIRSWLQCFTCLMFSLCRGLQVWNSPSFVSCASGVTSAESLF